MTVAVGVGGVVWVSSCLGSGFKDDPVGLRFWIRAVVVGMMIAADREAVKR